MTPKSRKRKLAASAPTKPSKPKTDTANGSSAEVKLESTARAPTGTWVDGADRPISSHERLIKVATDPPKRRVDLDEKLRALSIEFYRMIRTGQFKKAMEFANTVDCTTLDLSLRTITEKPFGYYSSPTLGAYLLCGPQDGSRDSPERDELLLSVLLSAGANDAPDPQLDPPLTETLYWAMLRRMYWSGPINRMRCVLDVMEAAPDRHGITYVDQNALKDLRDCVRVGHHELVEGGKNSVFARIIRLICTFKDGRSSPAMFSRNQSSLDLNSFVRNDYTGKWSNLVLSARGEIQQMLVEMTPVIDIDGYLSAGNEFGSCVVFRDIPWFVENCFHGEEGGVPAYVTAAVQRMAEYRMRRDALVRSLLADALPRELFPIIDAYGARPPVRTSRTPCISSDDRPLWHGYGK